jgi:hypothetical protein
VLTCLLSDIDHMLRSSATEEEGYNMQPPSVLRPLNGLRDRIAASALNEQYAVMQELSLILAQLVIMSHIIYAYSLEVNCSGLS